MHSSNLDNERDLDLLRNDPHGLVLKYQRMIRIIVQKYISSGMFLPSEFEDIRQTVNEQLLLKLPRIQKQYNGSAFVKTYVSAIIRNICLKLHEQADRVTKLEHLQESTTSDPDDFTDMYSVEPALVLFRAILRQYENHAQLPKLLLCLKLRFRMPISANDILRWYPRCGELDLRSLLRRFGGNYEHLQEREIYSAITPVINKAEKRSNTEDAIRKWMRTRIGEILELLNGSPPTASFDEDSLKVIVEDYFSPFLDIGG